MSKKEIVDEAFKIYENGELDCVDSVISYALGKYEEELFGIIEKRIREIALALQNCEDDVENSHQGFIIASRYKLDELKMLKKRIGIEKK